MHEFEFAGGGIPGFEHTQRSSVLIGKNNQDGWRIYNSEQLSIVLVADGCGSKSHSEVGSYLVLELLTASIERNWLLLKEDPAPFAHKLELALEASRSETLGVLKALSQSMLPVSGAHGGRASYSELVSEYLLCTVVGALLTPTHAGFFSIGDGVIVINSELSTLGPFEGNEPPYMAYSLLKTRWEEQQLMFTIHSVIPVEELETFLIGSDGVLDLRDGADQTLPGSSERIGSLSQFWSEDRYFTKSGIRKRLARIQSRQPNYSLPGGPIEEGRLRDDTTLIVGRRKKKGEPS